MILILDFIVKSHTFIDGNERADKLTKILGEEIGKMVNILIFMIIIIV